MTGSSPLLFKATLRSSLGPSAPSFILLLFSNFQTVEEVNDEEEFEEMMDQLLERDGGPPHVIADVLEATVDETHHDSQVWARRTFKVKNFMYR